MRPALLREVVQEVQGVTDAPLQLDTSDPQAMERAMRIYNGKPLVNSVNGKQESMDAVFPLVKKYGGAVIALTLDEQGIPETADAPGTNRQKHPGPGRRISASPRGISSLTRWR